MVLGKKQNKTKLFVLPKFESLQGNILAFEDWQHFGKFIHKNLARF